MFVKGLIMEVSVICEVVYPQKWGFRRILNLSCDFAHLLKTLQFGWNLDNPRGIIFLSTDDNSSFQQKGKWQILSCHNKPSEILEAASSGMVGTRQAFPGINWAVKKGLFVSLDHSWLLHFVMLPWRSVWKIIDILRSPLWETLLTN